MTDSVPAYGLWTLVIVNSLIFMHLRLASREERDALAEFGDVYRAYMHEVPAFLPRFSGPRADQQPPAHTST